ncbi:MAG: hypothetical protein IIY77_02635 [Lachnospiraceae bacterium]|nr:hypothetical protein [Lachnospiraceae bacterium]
MTWIYAVLHFLTDGLCAFSMFFYFRTSPHWYLYLLYYNFCAFALQMPLGAMMDLLRVRLRERRSLLHALCASAGLLLTVAGAFTHPVILGLGNSLFHVGGGIGTMDEEREKDRKGSLLGIFVSPGALGLFLGTAAGKAVSRTGYLAGTALFAVLFILGSLLLIRKARRKDRRTADISSEQNACSSEKAETGSFRQRKGDSSGGNDSDSISETASDKIPEKTYEGFSADRRTVLAVLLLFSVVVIRSYTGMAGGFSWKTGFLSGLLAVLCVAGGKTAGGFFAARFGIRKTMLITLGLSAVFYALPQHMIFGLPALLFFNMTMPVTLYMLAERLEDIPGFSFGLLTLALFLGFFPVWLEKTLPLPTRVLGPVMSLLSLAFMLLAYRLLDRKRL